MNISFQDMNLSDSVSLALADLGFKNPTPIQQQAIPVLLQGTKDFVGLAQTGTGKTAAFGLPLLSLVDTDNKNVQGLVICPTRELCIQIANDFKEFGKYMDNFFHVAVYGGSSIETQIKWLKKGVQIVVATPGRLIDLIERKAIKLEHVSHVVLDEADEMLNMGFRDDIEHILKYTTARQACWLFSATMPKEVKKIADTFMSNPFEIKVGEANVTAKNIKHGYYLCQASQKYEALKRIIDVNPKMYAIVFTRTKMEAQDITEKLLKENYEIDALHGDLSQQQRDKVMKRFREKTIKLLIATDVAARGIDVDDITHVINYALPDEPEVYTHRSGRTARAGKSGICLSLIHSRETGKLKDIERISKASFERFQIPSGKEVCEAQFFSFIKKLKETDISHGDYENYLPFLREQFESMDKDEIIQRVASIEFNRFLKYYEHAKDLNTESSRDRGSNSQYDRVFISLGGKDGFYKAAFLEFLLDNTGHTKKQLGKIELMDAYSFIETEKDITAEFIEAFEGKKYRGREIRIEVSNDKRSGGGGGRDRSARYEKKNNPGRHNEGSRENRGGGGDGYFGKRNDRRSEKRSDSRNENRGDRKKRRY